MTFYHTCSVLFAYQQDKRMLRITYYNRKAEGVNGP